MAKRIAGKRKDREIKLFSVRPTAAAKRDSRVSKSGLFQNDDEKHRVLDQLKLLRHWPPKLFDAEAFGGDLDFERISHGNVTFYEWRLSDPGGRGRELRVFFWVDDANRCVWIIHALWKKSRKVKNEVKCRVARRVRELRGQLQDKEHDNAGS